LEEAEAGRRVSATKIDLGTGERLGLLATATVGEGGWVDLPDPIIVRTGEAFVAVPKQARSELAIVASRCTNGEGQGGYARSDIPPYTGFMAR